jgi:PAS domain-containing protein
MSAIRRETRVSDHEGVSAPGRETQLPADIDVFELAAVGMVITDSTGCFCRVNPAFSRLLGRGRDELVGTSFNSLTSPDDVARSNAVMRDLLTKVVDTVQFEKRYLRPTAPCCGSTCTSAPSPLLMVRSSSSWSRP